MITPRHSQADAPLYEAAAAWRAEEARGLTPRRRLALDAWLAADPTHVRAYEAALEADEIVVLHAADPEFMALRHAALAARPVRFTPPASLIAASVAALVVLAGGGWWALGEGRLARTPAPAAAPAMPARYSTEVGERSTVVLPDGSTMALNTASVAEVAYSDAERRVRLLRGQALFTVAHGQAAPFRVQAGDRMITATGTRFDVRLDGDQLRVALVEGGVRVAPLAARTRDAAAETLEAGEVLTVAPGRPASIRAEDVARATSWRDGLVVFEDTPLDQAVAEINRYATRPIILDGTGPARHRISGAFRTGEPGRFADTLTDLFPLRAERSADGTIILAETYP